MDISCLIRGCRIIKRDSPLVSQSSSHFSALRLQFPPVRNCYVARNLSAKGQDALITDTDTHRAFQYVCEAFNPVGRQPYWPFLDEPCSRKAASRLSKMPDV